MKKTVYRFRLTALAVLAVLAMLVLAAGFSACENPSGGGGGSSGSSGGGGDGGDGDGDANPTLTGSVSVVSEGGTPQVGLAITANTSGLNGTGTFSYQWQRGDTAGGTFTNIDDATEASYMPVTGDVGKFIRVVVGLAGYVGTQTSTAAGPVEPEEPEESVQRADVTNLTRTTDNGEVTLRWTDPPDGDFASVEITWEPDGTTAQPVTKNIQAYHANDLTSGIVYTFTVKAVYTGNIKSDGLTVRSAFINIAEIEDYLANVEGGGSATEPIPLTVGLDLSISSNWTSLLSAIEGKYVALDLSACTMSSGTEFDPGTGTEGVGKVVSLVLPDAAISIKAGGYSNSTFENFTNLSSVSGKNIVTVGAYAFRSCFKLVTVSLPAAETIGTDAFYNCTRLASANLPKAKTIHGGAFSSCGELASVSLLEVETIGYAAFDGCTKLTEVSLPKATTIEDRAFSNCRNLITVSLPATLTTISGNPFEYCTNLTTIEVADGNPNYKSESGMLLNKAGTTLISYPRDAVTATLSAVTTIGEDAFSNCTKLTTVSLPAAENIGDSAFNYCPLLETVSLPAATFIGSEAFGSTKGTTLAVTLGNTVPKLGSSMFSYVSIAKTVTVKVPSGEAVWNSIIAIGTFSGDNSTVNWGNGFRGGGWTGSVLTYASGINSNITLTVVTE